MASTVIIGNGIAGTTFARWLRKRSDEPITLISEESDYFFSRTALMYVYMGHMRWEHLEPYEKGFWSKNKIELIKDTVLAVSFENQKLIFSAGKELAYNRLVLATGSKSNRLAWPGVHLSGVRGLYSKQDLEFIEQISPSVQQAVIVGGGLIGIELAEMFHTRNIQTTLLVREKEYWRNILPFEESQMISRHIRKHGIDLRLETELKEIHDNGQGGVSGVLLSGNELISCQFVGLTIGVSPNIDFLKNTSLKIDKGILVNEYLETNMANVYAIGDCAQLINPTEGRRSIEAVWYTGRKMGETLAQILTGVNLPYNPGIWFNSAKFFDIEYQVYGTVPPEITGPLDSFYWEHSSGEKSIRLVFEKETAVIKGFNLMGIRFRHEVCEKWIAHHAQVNEVLANIRMAFFDPEFFPDYGKEFISHYNTKTGSNISLKSSGSLNEVLRFFKSGSVPL